MNEFSSANGDRVVYKLSQGAVSKDASVQVRLEPGPGLELAVGHLVVKSDQDSDILASDFRTILLEGPEDTPQQITIGAYPNPFNPTTRIRFSLPTEQAVQLNVYDVTGQLVSVLVSDVRTAGGHTFVFNGSNLSSGLYIYTLRHNQGSLSGKLLLIK